MTGTSKTPDVPEVINIVGIPIGWAFLAFLAGAAIVAGIVYVLGTKAMDNDGEG